MCRRSTREKLRSACELLLKSIEFERAHPSASVSERFAAADPAKQAVKEYIQTWQGRPETRDLETSVITGGSFERVGEVL